MTTAIERLKEKKAKLEAQIREAEKEAQRKDAELYAERCRIVGAAVLEESKENENTAAMFAPIIDKHTTKAKDRKILGLDSLQKD